MSNSKKLTSLILLIAILLFGAYARGYRLFEWMPWEPDVGRDMVVARHMATGDGPPLLNVTSGSSSGLVVNSPVYFWVTTLLFSISNSPYGVAVVYYIWNIVGIILSYWIGKISNNSTLGLVYAFLISSNYIMVTMSQKIWQQSILPTLTILNVLFVLTALKKTHLLTVLILTTISFLGLHFHVSFYPIFIVNTLWLILLMFRLLKKNIIHGIICIINYISHLVLWASIIAPDQKINPLKHIEWAEQGITIGSYITQLTDITRTILSITFFNIPLSFTAPITGALFIYLIIAVLATKQKLSLELITVLYVLTIFGLALYPEPFFYGRLMVYYPLILLMIALVVTTLRKHRIIQIALILLAILSSYATLSVFRDPPPNQIKKTEMLTSFIYQDYINGCAPRCPYLPEFRIYSIENVPEESDWYTGQYWYFLEKESQKNLVRLVNTGNNLEPYVTDPKVRYLICPTLDREVDTVENMCVRNYLIRYNHLFGKSYKKINLPADLYKIYVLYKWQ